MKRPPLTYEEMAEINALDMAWANPGDDECVDCGHVIRSTVAKHLPICARCWRARELETNRWAAYWRVLWVDAPEFDELDHAGPGDWHDHADQAHLLTTTDWPYYG